MEKPMVKKHLEYYEWEEISEFLIAGTGISKPLLSCLIGELIYPDSGGIHKVCWGTLEAYVKSQAVGQSFSVEALVAFTGESCYVSFR